MTAPVQADESPRPAGWKAVPVDPTPEMIDAAETVDWRDDDTRGSVINMWHCMLAVAPEQAERDAALEERDRTGTELAGARTRIADLEARAAAAAAEMKAWAEIDAQRDRRERAQREMALCAMAEADDLARTASQAQAERDEARAELAQAREVLSRLEWDSWGYDPHAEGRSRCPCCGWTKDEGHAPDCALSAALAAKGE